MIGRGRSVRPARVVLVATCMLVGLWLIAPMFVVIPMSFTGEASLEFPPPSWSTRWYSNFFDDPVWVDALLTSLRIGLIVTVLSVVFGVAAALALVRGRFRGQGAVNALLVAPMVVPTVVLAIALYSLFLKWQLTGTTLGFVAAHTVLAVPYVIVTVGASLRQFDPRQERAAASLGATPLVTFARVTLPQILPGVLAGALFAFATSFDEVVISLFLVSPEMRTLPVEMFTSMTREVDPTTAVASTLMLTAVMAVLSIVLVTRRKEDHGSE
jgi:putative spermidine/putrescine transport system permease protein